MAMPLLFGLLFAIGVFVVFLSFDRDGRPSEAIEERLKGYGEIDPMTLDSIELQKPFAERVLQPILERAGAWVAARTPERSREALRDQLALAGHPGGLTVGGFGALRYLGAVALTLVALPIGVLVHQGPVGIAIAAAAGGLGGYFGPVLWLRSLTDARRKQIQRALPDAMDLLTISAEAGQSFDSSMQTVVEKFANALSDEFNAVIKETRLGRNRLEALEEMGRRTGVEDVNAFVQAIIQSEQMGVGVAKILRIQSAELRRRRRQRAQEQAAQASLKMMMPMVGCIFPTLWIILLGPAILVVLKARNGG